MSQQRYAYLIGANGPEQMALRYAESDALRLAEALMGPFCQFTEAKVVIAESRDAAWQACKRWPGGAIHPIRCWSISPGTPSLIGASICFVTRQTATTCM